MDVKNNKMYSKVKSDNNKPDSILNLYEN